MNKNKSLILIFSILIVLLKADQCQTTHMDFFSRYSLGKLDQLNRTFQYIHEKIPTLQPVTWKVNDSVTYQISQIKPQFYYRDSNQKGQIAGNDTVIVSGGDVIVKMNFVWKKTGQNPSQGTGLAIGASDQLQFYYHLIIKDGFLVRQLGNCNTVEFGHYGINITRIQNATQQDKNYLIKLFNDVMMSVKTVRFQLQEQIQKFYQFFLRQTLNQQHLKIDAHFDYSWKNDQGKMTIQFDLQPKYVDVQQQGITLMFLSSIKDYNNWKNCDFRAPLLPLNPKVYGGIQQFVTYDVYKNVLKYAVQNGYMDINLKRNTWESKIFQFYAGDLYQVIPKIAQKFYATQLVNGVCKGQSDSVDVKKAYLNHQAINASLNFNCQLSISNQKVSQFKLYVQIIAEGRPNVTHLQFIATDFKHDATFRNWGQYKIQNPTLAHHMLTHSMNRLLNQKVLGSQWPIFPRDYPHFITEDNYTVLYDSTHVQMSDY